MKISFNLLERIKESKNLVIFMVGLIFRICIFFFCIIILNLQ